VTDAEPVIDWEAKFHQQVSDNIRHKATAATKLADAQLRLDQANTEIRKLLAQVRKLRPAGEQLAAAHIAAQEAAESWSRRVRAKDDEIRQLKTKIGQGQRAILEDVVTWLDNRLTQLPKPDEGS
jgi:chromosome segregation ATPase